MQKGWKIAVIVLLIVAAAVAIGLKNRGSSEKAQMAKEPPAIKATTEETGTADIEKTTPENEAAVKEVTSDKPAEQKSDESSKPTAKTTPAIKTSTAANNPKPDKSTKNTPAVSPRSAEPEKSVWPVKLVELSSDMCTPCRQMKPVLEELKKEYAGKLEIVVIDVQENQEVAIAYGIQFIPTQVFYNSEGKEIYRHVGYFPKGDIIKAFKDHGIDLGK